MIHAYLLGSEAEGVARWRRSARSGPAIDTVAMVPPVELSEMHMDPPDPVPYQGDHLVLGGLPENAIDVVVDAAGPGSGSTLVSVEVRHAGGALGRGGEGHGALDRLPGEFLYFGTGMASDELEEGRDASGAAPVTGALRPTAPGAT